MTKIHVLFLFFFLLAVTDLKCGRSARMLDEVEELSQPQVGVTPPLATLPSPTTFPAPQVGTVIIPSSGLTPTSTVTPTPLATIPSPTTFSPVGTGIIPSSGLTPTSTVTPTPLTTIPSPTTFSPVGAGAAPSSGLIPPLTTTPSPTTSDDEDDEAVSPLPGNNTPAATPTPVADPEAAVAPVVGPPATGSLVPPVAGKPTLSFFMHDILGGSQPSARVVTGVIANSDSNGGIAFSKPNDNFFPVQGGIPLLNNNDNLKNIINNNNNLPLLAGFNGAASQNNLILQNSANNGIIDGADNQPFVTAGQLPSRATIQQLMFGSVTVIDDELTEDHELGSTVMGRAQGFYLASSLDGTSQTVAVTALFHGGGGHEYVEDSISFFGVHRTASPESEIAVIGGTGRYEKAKGYAVVETLHHLEDQHTTDGVDTIVHFSVYLTYDE